VIEITEERFKNNSKIEE